MTHPEEATLRKRKRTKLIIGVVFSVLSMLAIVVLPSLLVERSRQERERSRPAPRSAPAR